MGTSDIAAAFTPAITSVLVDRESATQAPVANRLGLCANKPQLIAQARKGMARVQAFVDDACTARTTLGSLDRSAQASRDMAARGLGTRGMFTSFAPADLALYRSLLRAPLAMPAEPRVLLQLVDHNTGQEATRYQESFLFIRVGCPGGSEAWYMVSVSVPSEIMCIMGLAWGLPKWLADEITIGENSGEVVYEGMVRVAASFRPDPAAAAVIGDERFGVMEPAVRFNPTSFGEPVLVGRDFSGAEVVERIPGWVTVSLGANEPLRALLPADATFVGTWQRYLPGAWQLWKY